MANSFSKEERVAFEDILAGFNDALVMSSLVNKYNTNGSEMERSSDTIWRPMPYIAQSYDGSDATSNFGDSTQLAVPATIGYQKHSTALLTAKELRDQLQEERLGKSAAQKLASDINVAVLSVASNQGTIVAAISTAATGYDDIAEADALMNELGIDMSDRNMTLSSRDYNGMAGNLAARQTLNEMPTEAYRRSYVGEVAGFQTHKMDYANRLILAAGTTVTVNGANQYHTPAATSTAGTGEVSNVDNRTQSLTIGVSSGAVKVGDAFTIAGVNSVHHITKQDTGQLKTFRVNAIVSGSGGAGVVTISPAIVSDGGSTDAEAQYKNVTATPADGAAITFLNIATAAVNPFFHKDAIELLPASLAIPTDAGADVMRATTEQGVELVMQKQFDINTQKTKYRWDTLFGVACVQPEMAGIMLFSQA
tara:strand:+ start:2644 stop:3912 length:1269 start_codon:yes stop_codon:yes gene_type:complete